MPVNTPLQNFEMKQLKKGGKWMESVDVKEINWYPLQKVSFARRKLEGANPATITRYSTGIWDTQGNHLGNT